MAAGWVSAAFMDFEVSPGGAGHRGLVHVEPRLPQQPRDRPDLLRMPLLLVGVPVTDVDDPDELRSAVGAQTALDDQPSVFVQRLNHLADPLVVTLLQRPSLQELESAHTSPPVSPGGVPAWVGGA